MVANGHHIHYVASCPVLHIVVEVSQLVIVWFSIAPVPHNLIEGSCFKLEVGYLRAVPCAIERRFLNLDLETIPSLLIVVHTCRKPEIGELVFVLLLFLLYYLLHLFHVFQRLSSVCSLIPTRFGVIPDGGLRELNRLQKLNAFPILLPLLRFGPLFC